MARVRAMARARAKPRPRAIARARARLGSMAEASGPGKCNPRIFLSYGTPAVNFNGLFKITVTRVS